MPRWTRETGLRGAGRGVGDKLFAEPFATLTEAQHAAVAAWCPPMMQTTGGVSLVVDALEESAQAETVQAKAA